MSETNEPSESIGTNKKFLRPFIFPVVETPATQPINYMQRMLWLTIVLIMFLVTFFICVIFSILYEKYTEEYSAQGNVVVQLFTVVFTILLAILKAVMNVVADKLDLSMGNGKFRQARALFGYVTDLFNYVFYRSLFLNISR
jgi:CBS domain containing-hemolysin-like protein